jgi:cell division protein ZipA
MSELRWTLLVLGVVFVAVLAWWERRRPRQAWAGRDAPADRARAHDAAPGAGPATRAPMEPWIGETELSEVVLSDSVLASAAAETDPSLTAGAAAGRRLEELPTLLIAEPAERIAPEETPMRADLDPSAAARPALEAAEIEWGAVPAPMTALEAADEEHEPPAEAAPEAQLECAPGSDFAAATEDEARREREPQPAERLEPSLASSEPSAAPGEPLVEWPPEESRRVLALRLIAPQPERFPGRTLRLALAAEGFVFGKFSIFHKPDATNRAMVSVASLSRPGSFDPALMDSQRYSGLSLFTVLPGPREPQQAFEELLAAARNLNERLAGALQDERGGPLTPMRVASLRDSLRAEAAVGS